MLKQVTLNGRTYHIGRLVHSQARDVFVILLRNLGPAAGELIAQLTAGKALQMDPKALGRAVQDVCLRLSSADLGAVSEAFGSVSVVVAQGKKIELTAKAMETHFQGAFGEYLEWLVVCVEHNYADFLELVTRASPSASVEPDSQIQEKAVE